MKKWICIYLFAVGMALPLFSTTPYWEVKGFHLDLRIQVMKMPALKDFARMLSEKGINTLVMEWEGSYPYRDHPLLSNRYAYSRAEIVDFVEYCRSIGIDVIPLQESFGHVEYILRHYRYANLREVSDNYSQVNPMKEQETFALFSSLYRDLIETHRPKYLHIGGDETRLLGSSEASRKKKEELGVGRLYGDYVAMLCREIVRLGVRPIIWADMLLKHPEAISLLPKETIIIDWNYGWGLNHFGDVTELTKSGLEIWGAPALRCHPDNNFLTDWKKHFNNIRTFIPQAKKMGYTGMVMTSWSTSGFYTMYYESTTDIYGMHTTRHVYPITGYNLLIDAYAEALKIDGPLDVDGFIRSYCIYNYRLTDLESEQFKEALFSTPFEINQGKIRPVGHSITAVIDSARIAYETFKNLKPSRSKSEFNHYALMAAIRLRYLEYINVEMQANAEGLRDTDIPPLVDKLLQLKRSDHNKEFIKMNRHVFHRSELEAENNLRNIKIIDLYERLACIK